MKLPITIFILGLLCSTAHSQPPQTGKIRIKTDPKDCSVGLVDSVTADWKKKGKWTEAELEPGQYTASIRGKDANIEFGFRINSKKTTEASVDFSIPGVFLKEPGAKEVAQIPCLVRADSGTVFEPPCIIYKETAEYPQSAFDHGIQGDVTVRMLVGKSGEVKDVKIRYTSGSKILDQSALQAALKYRFSPGSLNGKPTSCWMQQTIHFSISLR